MPITLLRTFCFILIERERFENCEGLHPRLRILQLEMRCQKPVDVIWYLSSTVKMLAQKFLRKTNLLGPVKQNNNSLVNKCLYDCS